MSSNESDDEDMRKKMENDSSSESEASVHEDKKEESDIEVKDVLNSKEEIITTSDKQEPQQQQPQQEQQQEQEQNSNQPPFEMSSIPSKSVSDNSIPNDLQNLVHTQKGFGKSTTSNTKPMNTSNQQNEQHKEQSNNNQNQQNYQRQNGFQTQQGFGKPSHPPQNFNNNRFRGDNFNNNNRQNGFNNNNNNNNTNNQNNSYNQNEHNFRFQRPFNNNNNNNYESNQQQQSHLNDDIIKKHSEYIHAIQKAFPNLNEHTSAETLKLIQSNSSQTIFEILNDFQTENTIQKTKQLYSQNKPFLPHIDILESIDHAYLNETDSNMIKYYKTYSTDNITNNDLPREYVATNANEKRRPLMKTEDGVYNYIPQRCSETHNENMNNLTCLYAHTDNEINYHTLTYKTKLCKIKNCDKQKCLNAHSFNELRIIYDYTNKEICKLMQLFISKGNTKVDNYSIYLSWNKQYIKHFDLNNFKTLKCKTPNCKKDPHLCYYFHSTSEKRRPQMLFRYSNQFCTNIEKGICPYGDFCHYCHTKYEFFYHSKNFRRIIPCTRKKNKNNECPYAETCYGKHGGDGFNDESVLSFGEKGNVNSKEKEMRNKLATCESVLSCFTCKYCKKVPKEFVYTVLACQCVLCLKCFKKCVKDNCCVVCEEQIEKGKTFKIEMGEKYKMIHKEEHKQSVNKNDMSNKEMKNNSIDKNNVNASFEPNE